MKWLESNITIYFLFFILFPLITEGVLFVEKQGVKSVFLSVKEKLAGKRFRVKAATGEVRKKSLFPSGARVAFSPAGRPFSQACTHAEKISFIPFYPDG